VRARVCLFERGINVWLRLREEREYESVFEGKRAGWESAYVKVSV
jgi:hypothetical protein